MRIKLRSQSFERDLVGAVLVDQERNVCLLIDGQMVGARDPLLRYFEVVAASKAERESLYEGGYRIAGLHRAMPREHPHLELKKRCA